MVARALRQTYFLSVGRGGRLSAALLPFCIVGGMLSIKMTHFSPNKTRILTNLLNINGFREYFG